MCFNLGKRSPLEERNRGGRGKQNSVSSVDELSSLREINVRIVHAGGRQELFQSVITASDILERHPGMVVARPEIFKRPCENDSVLDAGDKLLPGHKYVIMSVRNVERLKRRHNRRAAKMAKEEKNDGDAISSVEESDNEDSFASAKDYYLSREEKPEFEVKQSVKKTKKSEEEKKNNKKFVPPIQTPRVRKDSGWEPSLKSIQEISP